MPLHDIGKVGIPDSILKQQGSLTEDEWHVMKTHAVLGEQVLKATLIGDIKHTSVLEDAIGIAGCHHENWDGSAYPRGLRGLDIPLPARIMSLADTYDTLISERVYKDAWTHQMACEEIQRLKGIRFDPAVVEAFLMDQDKFIEISQAYRDAA
ncbi:HD-GYP domain-containing protein [Polynucleobacter necessarius]|uniref:HD-GYP domain-containing protein n=1 Tax=Polynucleobacter necessarius TaxID=576610 RepID=UPI000E092F9A|nr:HD domain-containing phosphohydrolase [Polynucleobacter necessarius]